LTAGACNTVRGAGGASEKLSSTASPFPVGSDAIGSDTAVSETGASILIGSDTSSSCFIPEKNLFIKFNGISPDF
jgi:hypothetical protein